MVQRFQGTSYHLEHIALSSGGGGDQLGNLAWTCGSCNLSKSDRVQILDPDGGELVAVFDPRSMTWSDHFEWCGHALVGRTAVGRALIHALRLNSTLRVGIREMEQDQGEFPPPES